MSPEQLQPVVILIRADEEGSGWKQQVLYAVAALPVSMLKLKAGQVHGRIAIGVGDDVGDDVGFDVRSNSFWQTKA